MNSQNMENRIRIRRDLYLETENDNFQLGNDGVKNDNNYKVKIMKLENRIKELRLEIDFNKVFDEEMERSLNNRISKLHKEKQLLSKELAVQQKIIENLERRNQQSTNNSLKEARGLNVPPKKKINKNQVQVQKLRGFDFGPNDPPSNQFNFGWYNEPAPNPMFFGRQGRQQVVYNSFNRSFPQHSTFYQNHGWCSNGHESLDIDLEPAPNPMFFGRQKEHQFVNNSFNHGFPRHSTFNQNHGWCHEHNMDRSYYCKIDDEKVCLKCLVYGSHNGHDSLDLDQNHGWCHEHNMKRSHYCKVDDELVRLRCLGFGNHSGHELLDLDLEQHSHL